MKKLLIPIVAIAAFYACTSKPVEKNTENVVEDTIAVSGLSRDSLLGSWVGNFTASESKDNIESSNKITLIIKNIQKDVVTGRSIVAGNDRPFYGKLIEKDGEFHLTLEEPGDDKYDGKFDIIFKGDLFEGSWESFNKNINVTKRNFKLTKKAFVYDATAMLTDKDDLTDWHNEKLKKDTATVDGKVEVYENQYYRSASDAVYKINSSMQELKESDLKNLRKLDLQILRNTIFARHGYSFKKETYRQFFDYVDWYVPISNNVEKELTSLEKKNIKLLEKFEKYAEDNYDTFGR
ncbi:YARHG domain-containing protein [Nubsella zeaxanthinifaciens]|uniref:YARHG domain-containing protein n=1 Tax=Nubsella zeaxanthinifaciens TaxID=392412 RepID=UPI003D040293